MAICPIATFYVILRTAQDESGANSPFVVAALPRAWRERYGDEWLALIGDSGLTVRIVLDVVLAAAAQRVRAAAWLITNENIAGDPPPSVITLRYMCADFLPRAGILCTTVLALSAAGIPGPPWMQWMLLFFRCEDSEFLAPRLKSRAARLLKEQRDRESPWPQI